MYFYRLSDVLREDYPATASVIGEVDFHNLITGYLAEYPPTEPSITHCGQHLAKYMRDHPQNSKKPWLADLVRLERALIEMLLAPDAIPLDDATMKSIPPSEWPSLKMRTIPGATILELNSNVSKIVDAIATGRNWNRPAKANCTIMVWRHNDKVFHRKVDEPERIAVKALAKGARFDRICRLIANQVGETRATRAITTMLQRWLAEGLLILDSKRTAARVHSLGKVL